VGLSRWKPAEPKLVDPEIAALVQEARWLSDAGWRMGKAIRRTVRLGDFCSSFLPERIFRFAARRTESGMSHGTTKSGAVISGDMILGLKLVWSQRGCEVLSGRKHLHQRIPSTDTAWGMF